jgi:hypothetical protein
MLANFENVVGRLKVTSRNGNRAKAFCPAHDDRNNPSLSIGVGEDGKVLLKCFAGCTLEDVVAAINLEVGDLFERANGQDGGGCSIPPKTLGTVKHFPAGSHSNGSGTISKASGTPGNGGTGCTLNDYAAAKKLPVEFLCGLSLKGVTYMDRPAVRIPYPDRDGQEAAVRFRVSLDGAEKFKWRSGDKPRLYGLRLLEEARKVGHVILVEGESDCHTLWYHDIPALGVPGATNWRNEWSALLHGIEKVYAVVEPDQGGEALWERLAASELKERLHRVKLEDVKDASELHLESPEEFPRRFEEALRGAVAWLDIAESLTQERARRAWELCGDLAHEEDILGLFAEELKRSEVAGESRTAKILYLAVTSRLLAKAVSVAVKGTSSSGKSYLVERTLNYFPGKRLLRAYGHERTSLGLLKGAPQEPLPRRLRGCRHKRRLPNLPHPLAAVGGPLALRGRGEDLRGPKAAPHRARRPHRSDRYHYRREASPRERDATLEPERRRHSRTDAGRADGPSPGECGGT